MKPGALRRLSVDRLAMACLALLVSAPRAAAESDAIPADFASAPGLLKSVDGATWVVGGDSLDRMLLLDWVEDVSARVERLTGLPRTRQGRGLGLVLVDDPAAPPAVESLQYLAEGRLEQRLRLTHGTVFSRDTLETELCRLFCWGYVIDHAAGAAPRNALAEWVAETVPAGVPDALAVGMRGALIPEMRAAASDLLYRDWTRGRLPTLATFLRSAGAVVVGPPEPGLRIEEAYAIMLVNWIATATTRAEQWGCVFARLAPGGGLDPDVLIECLSVEGARVADLEERWDAWILAQPRRIMAPGVTRPMDWARLRAELEIPRGQQGLPNDPDLPLRLSLAALAAHRGAAWMPRVAQAKALRLRTLALGRGEDLHAVVEPLCVYLDLLARGARTKRLEAAWAVAAAALDAWDAQGDAHGTLPSASAPKPALEISHSHDGRGPPEGRVDLFVAGVEPGPPRTRKQGFLGGPGSTPAASCNQSTRPEGGTTSAKKSADTPFGVPALAGPAVEGGQNANANGCLEMTAP